MAPEPVEEAFGAAGMTCQPLIPMDLDLYVLQLRNLLGAAEERRWGLEPPVAAIHLSRVLAWDDKPAPGDGLNLLHDVLEAQFELPREVLEAIWYHVGSSDPSHEGVGRGCVVHVQAVDTCTRSDQPATR